MSRNSGSPDAQPGQPAGAGATTSEATSLNDAESLNEAERPGVSPDPPATGRGGTTDARSLAVPAALRRPALQGLLALALYFAIFVVAYAFPLLRHPGLPQVWQSKVDPNFYIWSWRWWPYAISHGLNPLHSRQIGAPAGLDLSWATTTPAVAVLMAPVTVLFGPIASFNLTLLLAAPFSGWAAFVAARRLTGQFWIALMAGAVYGFAWYEVGETGAGHPNLNVVLLLPLMVYLALLWRDGKLGPRAFVGLLALAMAAEFYIFNETFLEMTGLGAAGLLIGFVVARPAQRHTVVRLAGLSAVAWVLAIVLASPYLIYSLRHAPASFTKVSPVFSLDLKDLVVPRSGILLLALVLALAVFTWSNRLARLLVILFVIVIALATGPDPVINGHQYSALPWSRLWYLPFVRSIEPLRFMIFANLLLAMILAVWLAQPTASKLVRASRWILGLATVAAIIANVPSEPLGTAVPAASALARPTNALPAFLSSGQYRHYVRPGEIVVVVSDRGNAGMLFQADTNFYMRIAGGFINRTFSGATGLPGPVIRLRHPTAAREQQFRTYVRRAGVGAILVEKAWEAPWMKIFGKMGLHSTQVGGVIVYRTAPAP